MSLTMRTIGKILIAISLIVVPFSMSHASMVDLTVAPQSKTVHVMHEHKHVEHNADHQMDQHSSDRSPHKEHDGANCCSSICGGALAIDVHQANCLASSKLIHVFGSKAIEPGESALPFRPPSI